MFMKRFLIALGITLMASVAVAQSGPSSRVKNDEVTIKALEQNITINYFDTRFGDVLEEWQGSTGLTFQLHESAADNNLDEEALVTWKFPETRLATVMKFVLEEYQCTWSIRDGVVVILSEDAAMSQLNLAVIDCTDVLAHIRPKTVTRTVPAHQPRARGFGGGVFSLPPQEVPSATSEEEAEAQAVQTPGAAQFVTYSETISPQQQLRQLVMDAVTPESWEENGGEGRIMPLNDLLVIRQTAENLREVRLVLEHLRAGGVK